MRKSFMIVLVALSAAAGCGDGGGSDAAPDGGGDGGGGGDLGAIEVTGSWDGAILDGATFKTAVFGCPFSMPPTYSDLDGAVDLDTGEVHGLVENIEPGAWCLMAYIDMDPGDGLVPVTGLDPVNATGAENENGAIALDVVAGQITPIDLIFDVE
jgi:hypothetical protein